MFIILLFIQTTAPTTNKVIKYVAIAVVVAEIFKLLEISFDSLLLCVIFKAIQLITQINEINYEKNVKCVGAGFGEQLNQLVNN